MLPGIPVPVPVSPSRFAGTRVLVLGFLSRQTYGNTVLSDPARRAGHEVSVKETDELTSLFPDSGEQ